MSASRPADLSGCQQRPGTEADLPGLLDLMRVVLPHDPRSPEYCRWQFLEGPAGPAAMRLIESDGRPVSLYVGTRKLLWLDGRIMPCFMIQDVLTHPDFRGRGFLNHMARAFLAEMDEASMPAFTFPNKLSENSFRRTAWTELMPIPLRLAATRPGQVADDSLFHSVESFGAEAAAIWAAAGLRIGVLRDAAFLNWRYARPGAVYHRSAIDGDQGFMVLKVYDRGTSRVVHVCDLVVRAAARRLLPAILAKIHAFAAANGADQITCWLPEGHPYAESFAAFGFARDPGNDRFAFTHGGPALLPSLSQPAAWHFSQADNDIY